MIKWPAGYRDENDVYGATEYGALAGRYPVGENRRWHSGIHIRNSTGIFPMISGELVAYRISSNLITVPRLTEISEESYGKLSYKEQPLYELIPSLPVKRYKMKSQLTDEEKVYKDEKHSNSFIMLKHYFEIPVSNDRKQIEFFTLYINLQPAVERESVYTEIQRIPKYIPFYEKYIFRVSENPLSEHPYIEHNGVKLFPRSFCTVQGKEDENTYSCNFTNFNNEKIFIETPKNDIELFEKKRYEPATEGVKIYRDDMPESAVVEDKMEDFVITTLIKNKKTYFKETVRNHYSGFYKVEVHLGEVNKKVVDEVEVNPLLDKNGDKIEKKDVLVRISDLIYTAPGCLKKDSKFFKDNNSKKIKGLMIYDKPNGNARRVLEKGEFELINPQDLLAATSASQYIEIEIEKDGEKEKKYILYRSNDTKDIEGQANFNDSIYKHDETITLEKPIKITTDDLLGYPYRPSMYLSAYYDLVLLFNDVSFMKETKGRLEGYTIPVGTVLYKAIYDKEEIISLESLPATNKIMIIREDTREIKKKKDSIVEYTRLIYEGKEYFLPSSNAESYRKNLLHWESFFKTLDKETGANALDDTGKYFIDFFKTKPDSDSDLLYNNNPDWFLELPPDETQRTRELKRTIVCCHPLEWDESLYIEKDKITRNAWRTFNIPNYEKHEKYIHFKNHVKAIDIWRGLKDKKIPGLDLTRNSFWFSHPVYFVNHIARSGLTDNYVNVAYNVKDLSVIEFYKHIAEKSKGENIYNGTQCVLFVYNIIKDLIKDGNVITRFVFPGGVKLANLVYDDFIEATKISNSNDNKKYSLENISVNKDIELDRIQEEADKGTLILAVFENYKYPIGGPYNGHIAFIGCSSLKVDAEPPCIIKNDKGEITANYTLKSRMSTNNASRFDMGLWLLLVQAGVYRGIAPIRLGTNGWTDNTTRAKLFEGSPEGSIRFYKIKRN